MEQAIGEMATARRCAVAVACQLQAAAHATNLGEMPAIAEEVELGLLYDQFRRASDPIGRLRYGLTWRKHVRYLGRLLQRFDACSVVSEPERELLRRFVPNAPEAHVLPNGVALEEGAGSAVERCPDVLVFAGALSYFANRRGIEWFVEKVLPSVTQQRPEVRLIVTGDPAGVDLGERVEQIGHVEDVRPVVAAASVSIAPILEGGGTRLKILEAMALGTPVVSTRKGAEGLDVVAGQHLMVADHPSEFAACVLRLLADRDLAADLAANARRFVAQRDDWSAVGRRLEELILDVARRRRGP